MKIGNWKALRKPFHYLPNSKGYTLLETMISLAILGTIAGSTMILINNQSKYIYYLEDRLSLANLREEIAQVLRVGQTCNNTFRGKKLENEPKSFEVIHKSGKVLYTHKEGREINFYERLNITNLTYKNVDVPVEMGSGWMEVAIHTQRQRKGGGPDILAPKTFRMRVSTNTHQQIASCDTGAATALDCGTYKNGEIKSMTEGSCPDRKIRRDICVASLWLMYDRKDDPDCNRLGRKIQSDSVLNNINLKTKTLSE